MGWSIGYDGNWKRDVGYGVPAVCDHPKCNKKIDRGLSYVCGGDVYGGEAGCGLYFCEEHLVHTTGPDDEGNEENSPQLCERCAHNFELGGDRWEEFEPAFEPKPDVKRWLRHKLTDKSWQEWRNNHPTQVEQIKDQLSVNKQASQT